MNGNASSANVSSNLTCLNGTYIGLIGYYIGNFIKLTIQYGYQNSSYTGSVVSGACTFANGSYIGALAGYMVGSLINISSNINITVNGSYSGLIGYLNGSANNINLNGLYIFSTYYGIYQGAFAGLMNGSITGLNSSANITVLNNTTYIGIVGYLNSTIT